MNIHKLYSELLDYYFDIEQIIYKIEDNIIFVEGYYSISGGYHLFEFDLNKMIYTEIFNNGDDMYQENLIVFIVKHQKYWNNKFYKVISKLNKVI